jgi:cytochrome P450
VINEGLRISSPVTTRLPRIAPNEEMAFKKWRIPAGVCVFLDYFLCQNYIKFSIFFFLLGLKAWMQVPVSMSYYFIHYDTTIFPSLQKFNPSRWIEAQERGERLEKYLVPFSKGSRNCIGIK